MIIIEIEADTGGPEVPHSPHHGCAVQLMEGISRINENKSQLIFGGVLQSHKAHGVYYPFDT